MSSKEPSKTTIWKHLTTAKGNRVVGWMVALLSAYGMFDIGGDIASGIWAYLDDKPLGRGLLGAGIAIMIWGGYQLWQRQKRAESGEEKSGPGGY